MLWAADKKKFKAGLPVHKEEKGPVQSMLPFKDKQEALTCIKEDKSESRGFSLMPDI